MQLRSDWTNGQKLLTDRLQILMSELDETKKQRAGDAVELSRLRSLLMQLDAKSMLNPSDSANGGQSIVKSRPIDQNASSRPKKQSKEFPR